MSDYDYLNEDNVKTSRVIDFKIPLPWLLGVAGVTVLFFFNMWATQNALLKSVTDLEITVKSGNASMGTLTSEVALLKFRVSTNEEIMKQHSLLLQEKGRK